MHRQHGEQGPAFIQVQLKMSDDLSNNTDAKTLHNEVGDRNVDRTLKHYLTKFLLYVGVDVDVIHTVRHFLRLSVAACLTEKCSPNVPNNETGNSAPVGHCY